MTGFFHPRKHLVGELSSRK